MAFQRGKFSSSASRKPSRLAPLVSAPSLPGEGMETRLTQAARAHTDGKQKPDLYPLIDASPRQFFNAEQLGNPRVVQRDSNICTPGDVSFLEVKGMGGQQMRVPQPPTIPLGWSDPAGDLGRGFCRRERRQNTNYGTKNGRKAPAKLPPVSGAKAGNPDPVKWMHTSKGSSGDVMRPFASDRSSLPAIGGNQCGQLFGQDTSVAANSLVSSGPASIPKRSGRQMKPIHFAVRGFQF